MRRLEPFSYFNDHASAITGFGGVEKAPDPRYCFHTHYEELRPGRTIYRLTLVGARASMGELSLRVHGFKAGSNADVSLVGGAQRMLDRLGLDEGRDVELTAAFSAVKGVQYALYGFFSEASDLRVEDIVVAVEEIGDIPAEPEKERGWSRFSSETIDASRLYADGLPSLGSPVSQDCVVDHWPAEISAENVALGHWQREIVLSALESYGMLDGPASGGVEGPPPEGLKQMLEQRGCRTTFRLDCEDGEPDAPAFHDFIVSYALDRPVAGVAECRRCLQETMACLLRGGMAFFVFRYFAAADGPVEGLHPSRREIEQWALWLIGMGHDVAQLAFAPAGKHVVLSDGCTPFILIVRSG